MRIFIKVFLIVFLLITMSARLVSFPRRSDPNASWQYQTRSQYLAREESSGRSLASAQGHAGPMLFVTFSEEDINRQEVLATLDEQRTPKNLRALWRLQAQSKYYRDFIHFQLETACLPAELSTIVQIESAYKVLAESRTGARGLWQFAANSMAPWMHLQEEYPAFDQRFDFWISTEAAVQKLLQNYKELGNWLLAVAAYNGGLGRVSRARNTLLSDPTKTETSADKASKASIFWQLPRGNSRSEITPETNSYIPKYISAALLSTYPGRSGIPLEWSEPFHWNRIIYSGSLTDFAQTHSIPLEILQAGNPEYLDGTIPEGRYYLKYPASYNLDLELEIADGEYQVQPGDTLWSISREHSITVAELQKINGISQNELLQIGQVLKVKLLAFETSSTDNLKEERTFHCS